MSTNPIQPAYKNYFFSKAYIDLKNVIKGAWRNNNITASRYSSKISSKPQSSTISKIFRGIFYIFATASIYVAGSIMCVILTLIHVSIVFLIMSIVYMLFSLTWAIDRLYLKANKIFTTCTKCHSSSSYLLPTYICPNCGEEHTRLVPNTYGIFKHVCAGNGGTCNQKLPCTFFSNISGYRRKDLSAICPNPKCKHPLHGKESVPLCFPVIGGPSAGKTMYITAFIHEFSNKVIPANDWSMIPYSMEKEKLLTQINSDFMIGDVTKTSDRNSISYNFFLKSNKKQWHPNRLFFIYDIAGEVFGSVEEQQMQRQYQYCHGIVFIIDPYASYEILMKYGANITGKDKARISPIDTEEVLNSFINKFKDITGKSSKEIANVPIAIVINKTDIGDLQKYLNYRKVQELATLKPVENNHDNNKTIDELCRGFLQSNGMSNFVKTIDTRFKNNQFFFCSSLGHTINMSYKFEPQNVIEPIKWLMKFSDTKIFKSWGATQ